MSRRLLSVCLAAALAAGCASSGSNYDEARVREIRVGETTEADMIDMFGEPTGRRFDSSGSSDLTWSYHESKTNGKSFIPYAGMFLGGSDNRHKMLMATINPEGVVTSFSGDVGGMSTRGHTQSKNRNKPKDAS